MTDALFPPFAVIADAHVHDPRTDFGFPGAARTGGLSVRPLAEAARSTRAFNESLAAFRTALADIAARGIRHVVLLGDYTDDGQVATTASLARLLDEHAARFGMAFYATVGNHDIFADRGRDRTKRFLTDNGGSEIVTSHPGGVAGDPPVTVSDAMACRGYPDGLMPMAAHGFFPKAGYLHWESPFGGNGAAEARTYAVRSPSGRVERRLMEASYLVEPVDGLWLMMIDANVFVPLDAPIDGLDDFADSTSAGWNAMLVHKPFVLAWMKDVADRAERLGKRLVAFSHYPALDPLDGTRAAEIALLGQTATAGRLPLEAVGEAFIETGIALHVSGHLHVNDTARMRRDGGWLVNLAVPSLAGFPPAYKIFSFARDALRVETVTLDDMPLDPAIGALYAAEIRRTGLDAGGMEEARTYGDFLSAHIGHIASRRHLKREWPADLARLMRTARLADLARLAFREILTVDEAVAVLAASRHADRMNAALAKALNVSEIDTLESIAATAFLGDWYRVRMGSDLGLRRVGPARLALYGRLSALYRLHDWPRGSAQDAVARIFALLDAYRSGLPSGDFTLDLSTGGIAAA